MSLRHNLILLLTGACCALALIGPSLAPHRVRSLGSIVTAAPPLVIDGKATAGVDDVALVPLRREASGALGQLRARAER
ncbi:MAG: hypothetical protein JSR61_02730 [Proteobacteria bacterium]|nr:hypothetical protein [Pseudomonadota bacterium]